MAHMFGDEFSNSHRLSKSRSSGLRIPLQDLNLPNCEAETSTSTFSAMNKRRVSFNNKFNVKEFNADERTAHVLHAPEYEEQLLCISSDSSCQQTCNSTSSVISHTEITESMEVTTAGAKKKIICEEVIKESYLCNVNLSSGVKRFKRTSMCSSNVVENTKITSSEINKSIGGSVDVYETNENANSCMNISIMTQNDNDSSNCESNMSFTRVNPPVSNECTRSDLSVTFGIQDSSLNDGDSDMSMTRGISSIGIDNINSMTPAVLSLGQNNASNMKTTRCISSLTGDMNMTRGFQSPGNVAVDMSITKSIQHLKNNGSDMSMTRGITSFENSASDMSITQPIQFAGRNASNVSMSRCVSIGNNNNINTIKSVPSLENTASDMSMTRQMPFVGRNASEMSTSRCRSVGDNSNNINMMKDVPSLENTASDMSMTRQMPFVGRNASEMSTSRCMSVGDNSNNINMIKDVPSLDNNASDMSMTRQMPLAGRNASSVSMSRCMSVGDNSNNINMIKDVPSLDNNASDMSMTRQMPLVGRNASNMSMSKCMSIGNNSNNINMMKGVPSLENTTSDMSMSKGATSLSKSFNNVDESRSMPPLSSCNANDMSMTQNVPIVRNGNISDLSMTRNQFLENNYARDMSMTKGIATNLSKTNLNSNSMSTTDIILNTKNSTTMNISKNNLPLSDVSRVNVCESEINTNVDNDTSSISCTVPAVNILNQEKIHISQSDKCDNMDEDVCITINSVCNYDNVIENNKNGCMESSNSRIEENIDKQNDSVKLSSSITVNHDNYNNSIINFSLTSNNIPLFSKNKRNSSLPLDLTKVYENEEANEVKDDVLNNQALKEQNDKDNNIMRMEQFCNNQVHSEDVSEQDDSSCRQKLMIENNSIVVDDNAYEDGNKSSIVNITKSNLSTKTDNVDRDNEKNSILIETVTNFDRSVNMISSTGKSNEDRSQSNLNVITSKSYDDNNEINILTTNKIHNEIIKNISENKVNITNKINTVDNLNVSLNNKSLTGFPLSLCYSSDKGKPALKEQLCNFTCEQNEIAKNLTVVADFNQINVINEDDVTKDKLIPVKENEDECNYTVNGKNLSHNLAVNESGEVNKHNEEQNINVIDGFKEMSNISLKDQPLNSFELNEIPCSTANNITEHKISSQENAIESHSLKSEVTVESFSLKSNEKHFISTKNIEQTGNELINEHHSVISNSTELVKECHNLSSNVIKQSVELSHINKNELISAKSNNGSCTGSTILSKKHSNVSDDEIEQDKEVSHLQNITKSNNTIPNITGNLQKSIIDKCTPDLIVTVSVNNNTSHGNVSSEILKNLDLTAVTVRKPYNNKKNKLQSKNSNNNFSEIMTDLSKTDADFNGSKVIESDDEMVVCKEVSNTISTNELNEYGKVFTSTKRKSVELFDAEAIDDVESPSKISKQEEESQDHTNINSQTEPKSNSYDYNEPTELLNNLTLNSVLSPAKLVNEKSEENPEIISDTVIVEMDISSPKTQSNQGQNRLPITKTRFPFSTEFRNHECCYFKYLSSYLFSWLFFDGVLSLIVELYPEDENRTVKDVKIKLNRSENGREYNMLFAKKITDEFKNELSKCTDTDSVSQLLNSMISYVEKNDNFYYNLSKYFNLYPLKVIEENRLMYEVVSSKNRCWIQVFMSDQIIWHPISDEEISIKCIIGSVELSYIQHILRLCSNSRENHVIKFIKLLEEYKNQPFPEV
ncbi:uncharacterized protein LOC142324768 [Lycorma delicatula]|uniref:uncharacterized protein LOC142324768 n=1 Tax=Lycorma delicatula TaxID=130591 RepID=UPI003F51276B